MGDTGFSLNFSKFMVFRIQSIFSALDREGNLGSVRTVGVAKDRESHPCPIIYLHFLRSRCSSCHMDEREDSYPLKRLSWAEMCSETCCQDRQGIRPFSR